MYLKTHPLCLTCACVFSRTVYKKLFQKLDWKQVGALTEDSNKYSEYLSDLLYNVTDGLKVTNVKMKTSDNIVEVSVCGAPHHHHYHYYYHYYHHHHHCTEFIKYCIIFQL